MSKREEFIERWKERVCDICVQYIEGFSGMFFVRIDRDGGRLFDGSDGASPTPDEAWAKADAAMVERFGEPKDTSDETFQTTQILRASDILAKWMRRAKARKVCLWGMDIKSYTDRFEAHILKAAVSVEAPTWYEAVIACDAKAEPVWQARKEG